MFMQRVWLSMMSMSFVGRPTSTNGLWMGLVIPRLQWEDSNPTTPGLVSKDTQWARLVINSCTSTARGLAISRFRVSYIRLQFL